MTDRSFDFSTMFGAYRDAFAPVARAQQEGLKAFERFARHQFALAGDYLDWALAHANAAVNTKSPTELASRQSELNVGLGDKLRGRAEEFSKLAKETQGAVTQWFDTTSAKVNEAVKKAA
ncbi:MAG: phasin family protein [Proteobacteria bacterium]|nr:phasin family protein [Pseudomonadota bacterium]